MDFVANLNLTYLTSFKGLKDFAKLDFGQIYYFKCSVFSFDFIKQMLTRRLRLDYFESKFQENDKSNDSDTDSNSCSTDFDSDYEE